MKNRTTALGVFLAIVSLPLVAQAQTASLTGTVTDSSGALVPHAKVVAVRTSTNISRSGDTGETGTYRITNLTPGVYDVHFDKPGFKSVLYSKVELTVDQVLTLDARLDPSPVTEVINVNGQSLPPIDFNDAQVGNIVDSRQTNDLPLILRDPYQLVLLSPGVIQSNSLLGGFAVNGSRERNNNFLLDGTDNNDAEIPGFPRGVGGPILGTLNPDMAQEFRVITNNYLPEFGRNTGAIVDVITRGGTNDLHGDVYWFGRYDALGARDFFNHAVNPATGQLQPKNPFVRNDFGASGGGPIINDRTFWFANYEGQRFATTLTNSAIVPTAAFKSGNFTFNGVPITLCQPGSSPCVPLPPQQGGNNIFGLPLDPTIQKILSLYPNPNGPMLDDIRGLLFFPSSSLETGDDVTARIDHYFTAKEMFTARYTFNRFDDTNTSHTDFLPGLGSVGTRSRTQNLSLRLTSTLGQTVTNELRFGGNRINFPVTCQGTSVMDAVGTTDQFGRGLDYLLPGLSGFGCLLPGDSGGLKRFSGTYTTGDSVALLRGRHAVKTGFEFRDVYSNSLNDFLSRTTASFNNFSASGDRLPAFFTGSGIDGDPLLQDMVWSLFGGVGSEVQAQYFNQAGNRTSDDLRGLRQREFNVFGQDSYQFRPNITVSYGLRYQFNGVPFEVNNQLSTLLADPSGTPPLQCPSMFGLLPCFAFTVVGRGGGSPSLYKNDWKDFEPRIGVAWDPFKRGKTSVRAGYGIFHDRVYGQLLGILRGDPPFQEIAFFNGLSPASLPPPVSSLPAPATVAASPNVLQGSGSFPFLIDRNLRMPYSQNWNLGVQHEYFRNLLFEVNYVGTKGTRLLRLVDPNPPQPALVSQLEGFCMPGNAFGCDQSTLQFNNLYFGAESGLLPRDAVNNNAFLHGNLFTGIANSTYHSLQANITKRLSRGFAFQGAYTWSHAIDDASDPLVASGSAFPGATGNQTFPRNSLDLRGERGNSDFDVTHRLVLNYTWDLPVGPGHDHFAEGFLGKVFEGWQLGGITTFSSGLPFDIFTPIDSAHTGEIARPDFNPSAALAPTTGDATQTGPPLALFSLPPFGRPGNLGRNRFRGPGINNCDTVLTKATRLGERFGLDMRFEFYNLFNRPWFYQPDNLIQDGSLFGHSTEEVRRQDQTTGARQVQLAMKLRF